MPRDPTQTRDQLLAAAEELFAERGIWQVPVREIVASAQQRNSSALTYHFGSRSGALKAILDGHNAVLERRRTELLTAIPDDAPTRDLVDVLVVSITEELKTASGRNYLRIVSQLIDTFAEWEGDPSHSGDGLGRALRLLCSRPTGTDDTLGRQRVLGMIMLMTTSLAERARQLSEPGAKPELDADAYADNLTAMLTGIIEAPV